MSIPNIQAELVEDGLRVWMALPRRRFTSEVSGGGAYGGQVKHFLEEPFRRDHLFKVGRRKLYWNIKCTPATNISKSSNRILRQQYHEQDEEAPHAHFHECFLFRVHTEILPVKEKLKRRASLYHG